MVHSIPRMRIRKHDIGGYFWRARARRFLKVGFAAIFKYLFVPLALLFSNLKGPDALNSIAIYVDPYLNTTTFP